MTTSLRIPFGMDRLPRALSPDDPRLPGVTVGAEPLRLNTEPLPAEAMVSATADHAARVTAIRSHLHSQCGDYAPLRLGFVDAYLESLTAHIDAHREELSRQLQTYDGLYAPEDWLWSALRPLPRAWLRRDAGMEIADFAFWDGVQAIAIDLAGGSLGTDAGTIVRICPDVLAADPPALWHLLPEAFHCFWRAQTLPVSPFRRAIPRGVVARASPR
jgi:hypothetical protein